MERSFMNDAVAFEAAPYILGHSFDRLPFSLHSSLHRLLRCPTFPQDHTLNHQFLEAISPTANMRSAVLAALAAVSYTAPAAANFYEFYDNYDDKGCTGNKITDTHFQTADRGCFNMNGAKCAKDAGGSSDLIIPNLIAYSAPDCPTSAELGCNNIEDHGTSASFIPFDGPKFQWAQGQSSFKFDTSCPTACLGECPGGHAPGKRLKRDSGPAGKARTKRNKPKDHDYAWYDSDDCSGDAGTSIEPATTGDCQLQANRRSIYNNGDNAVSFAGFREPDQTCPTDQNKRFSTFSVPKKSCKKVMNYAEGGANAYLEIGFGG